MVESPFAGPTTRLEDTSMNGGGQGAVARRNWWRREETRMGTDGAGPSQDLNLGTHVHDKFEERSPAMVSIVDNLARAAGELLGRTKADTARIKVARWYRLEEVAREYWKGGMSPCEAIEKSKDVFRDAVARGVLEPTQ